MIKQSLITLATLGLFNTATLAVDLTTCIGCHGKNFEKPAMNTSRIVKDLTKEEIKKALYNYKEGSHGGSMKDVMNNQISKFTDKEIEEIIDIITTGEIEGNVHLDSNQSKKEAPKIEVNTDNCISCHGVMFEKSAMGYSRIVNQMSKEDIIASLNGYKNGTYGGNMKALMANQATRLSEEEIEAFAEIISNISN
ncbi:Cytochrome c, class I [hydrothermal vent metagenome]|uniref:Cytochrome c, class I n=1 Tax=hydrothermal vent metagenome TaxID=652676 RepID=A0A1W1CMP7_9ZZZZ